MFKNQTNNRNLKLAVATVVAVCGLFAACQETVTIAEEELDGKNSMKSAPESSDPDTLEEETTTDSAPAADPEPADVCDVIPDLADAETVARLDDGSAVVGGRLNGDVYAEVVFGEGEENETALPTDPYGPNQGFVAKYNADLTLAWVKGGISSVSKLIAEENGETLVVLPRYVLADPDTMQLLTLDAQGETVSTLFVPFGDAVTVNEANRIFVAGSFPNTVTLGEGDTAVTFEKTDPQVAYGIYVAAYNADQSLAFAVELDNLYIANNLAVSDNAIALVDNSGTLVYMNGDGEELWRRKAGSDVEITPETWTMTGTFIDFGTTDVRFETDSSVLWSGGFIVSAVFSDDQGNEVSLFAPYEVDQNGGEFHVYPFAAHYTAEGVLQDATSSADQIPEPENPGC